ncbi:hypothetical protein ANO11243_095620 [Dothideomycetidae sp. 11243]|nr:hypothetical protein ANO11243_095620 [fungal sp. No.11243]
MSKSKDKEPTAEQSCQKSPRSFLHVAGTSLDPTLSTLFSSSGNASINPSLQTRARFVAARPPSKPEDESGEDGSVSSGAGDEVDDEVLSELASDDSAFEDEDESDAELENANVPDAMPIDVPSPEPAKRRRKKADEHEDLESKYLEKLSKDVAKATKAEQAASRKGERLEDVVAEDSDANQSEEEDDDAGSGTADGEDLVDPVQHETVASESNEDLEKAQRTVFLGNVSTTAITSKSALKTLNTHLASFFASLPDLPASDPARAVESLRFRSTPFAAAIPKRAAFARKEVMDATSHSTNAYAVYSTASLAREACKRLNGTIVLDRHLRVDSVAHPAKVDHKRCIFVGNLAFVDDESFIDAANAEEGREQRKGKKIPSDIEEGLWRTFSKCGTVESVRVVRDAKTRVGKGFAYVQFSDENAVESALLNNEKKFPPMLPRKLRVVRAKPIKRSVAFKRAGQDEGRRKDSSGYVKKLTPQQQSQMGRAAKLLGKSAANQMRRSGPKEPRAPVAEGIKAPESFVFEGYRARSGLKPGLKTKKGNGKKPKPTKNSVRRGAAWKEKKAKA